MGYDLANEILADIMQAEVWKKICIIELERMSTEERWENFRVKPVVTAMSSGDPSTPSCKGKPREITRADQLIPQLTGRFLS